jgi:hypothetical protein
MAKIGGLAVRLHRLFKMDALLNFFKNENLPLTQRRFSYHFVCHYDGLNTFEWNRGLIPEIFASCPG